MIYNWTLSLVISSVLQWKVLEDVKLLFLKDRFAQVVAVWHSQQNIGGLLVKHEACLTPLKWLTVSLRLSAIFIFRFFFFYSWLFN